MNTNYIEIYTDGGCRGNGKDHNIGGYGVLLSYNGYEKQIKKGFTDVTNNQMELLAVIDALKELKRYDIPIVIYSDSAYVVNTINENWKINANKELWNELFLLLHKIQKVCFVKVKGHSTNQKNNLVDKLANEAMDEIEI